MPPRAAGILAKFPDKEDFLLCYSPSLQAACAAHPARCYKGEAPTLRDVAAAYGTPVAQSWIEIQLENLAEYAGVREKLNTRQSMDTATAVLAGFQSLNCAELLLFFARFKAGCYGRFYGAVDPLAITDALRTFCKERREEITRIEEREAMAERLRPREGCVSHEEYLRIKARAEAGDAEAAMALRMPA